MSIATLKRKTESMYKNVSVGAAQFSLNGTRRTQGYIGQTSLSRHLQRTPMKGNVIRGNGGCCGTYRIFPVITSGVQSIIDCLNDPRVVKTSVVNTGGMLEKKYVVDPNAMHTGSQCKCYWTKNNVVKPDSNQHLYPGDYTNLLGKKTLACENQTYLETTNDIYKCTGTTNKRLYRATNYNTNMRDICGITKPEWKYVAMSQSSHIDKLISGCASANKKAHSSIGTAPTFC